MNESDEFTAQMQNVDVDESSYRLEDDGDSEIECITVIKSCSYDPLTRL